MIWFFRLFVWLIFIGLLSYVVFFWRYEERVTDKLQAIRKSWYLLYILGALVYWSVEPASVFEHWQAYFIVAIFFALVDAFVFLSLYLRKFGTGELEAATQQTVENSQELIREHLHKLQHTLQVLSDASSLPAAPEGLSQLLAEYAKQENLTIDLYPFSTRKDQLTLIGGEKNQPLLRSALHRGEIYYNEEEQTAFYPVGLETGKVVLKLTSDSYVSEVDCTLIGILIAAYNWSSPNEARKAVALGGTETTGASQSAGAISQAPAHHAQSSYGARHGNE